MLNNLSLVADMLLGDIIIYEEPSIAADDDGTYRRMNFSFEAHNSCLTENHTMIQYRAGIPALYPLPLDTQDIDGSSASKFRIDQLEENRAAIDRIFQEAAVKVLSMRFAHRFQPGKKPSQVDSRVFVRAKWEENSGLCWFLCAQKITSELSKKGLDIGVEIIADDLCVRKYVAVVDREHPFVDIWNTKVREQVRNILSASSLRNNFAVNVIRVGFNNDAKSCPITILVSANYNTLPFQWVSPKSKIEKLLAKEYAEFKIVTLIEHGEVEFLSGVGSNVPDDNYFSVDLGALGNFTNKPDENFDSKETRSQFQIGYDNWENHLKVQGDKGQQVKDLVAPFDRIYPGIRCVFRSHLIWHILKS